MPVETSKLSEHVKNQRTTSAHNAETLVQSPKLREAVFEDYPRIAALQIANGLPTKPYEEWKHQWVNNPAYTQIQAKLPVGWVLESYNDEIVGSLGNIPLFYELDGQRLLASVAHAWVVDTRYRSYSLWLLHQYFSQKSVELFLNATVGPAANESFAVFESVPVPVGDWDHSAFSITHYQGFLASWLALKAVPCAKLCSYILSIGPFLKDALARRESYQCNDGTEIEQCVELDGRFDIFWDNLRKANPGVLLAVRTRQILEWHFRYALHNDRAWIVTASEGPTITAYGIFLRQDNPTVGLKRIRLVDFQALDGNIALLEPIVLWALERCRNERIDMLESIGFRPDKSAIISKLVPYKRKLPCWLYFYKTRDKNLAEILSDVNVWDPSQFDGDASL
jgi:hypothetical protein